MSAARVHLTHASLRRLCAGLLAAALLPCARAPAAEDGSLFFAVASAPAFSAVARADSGRRSARELADDDDEHRPDDPLSFSLFGRPLRVTGEYELRSRYLIDPRFGERDDDRVRGRHELQIELLYALRETLSFFAEAKAGQEDDLYREDGDEVDTRSELRRGETWLLWEQIAGSGVSLQLGRQKFRDPRGWWWDQNLDAARLRYALGRFDVELGLAEELARESNRERGLDPEADGLRRWLGRAGWQLGKRNRLEFFALAQRDRSDSPSEGDRLSDTRDDESDANLTWLGLRASGQSKLPRRVGRARIDYWLDLAQVRGHEAQFDFKDAKGGGIKVDERTERDVRGWALDGGATLSTRLPGEPRFTAAYALGSGDDDPDDGTDTSFRQTGLQRNEGRFRGTNRFRYYGDLLSPELSNLQLWTLSVGVPLREKSSLELAYHRYRQLEASKEIRGSGLAADPRGRHRDIGQELDLSLGLEPWELIDLELNASVFRAGSAFGASGGEIATGLDLEISFNF